MKVLTAHTNRDYFFLKILGFLQLLAAERAFHQHEFLLLPGAVPAVHGWATFTSSEIRRATQQRERRWSVPACGVFPPGWQP